MSQSQKTKPSSKGAKGEAGSVASVVYVSFFRSAFDVAFRMEPNVALDRRALHGVNG